MFVSFTINEKPAGCMCVKEDMMFAELATKFCENYGLKEDNKPTFYFNSQEIKSESTRTLKEYGIVQMYFIQVKTPKDFNIPAYNANTGNNAGNMGNFQMNTNQFMGNYVNSWILWILSKNEFCILSRYESYVLPKYDYEPVSN